MLTLKAPAKINLTLEVLGKRPDDFHEIRTVMQTVGMYDTLHFETSKKVLITSNQPDWSAGSSLVPKTVQIVKEAAGYKKGVAIHIEKRIPLMSGLGGDSSDAAAVLRGLVQLWSLNLDSDRIVEMARELGSDVAFFLNGGTALGEGRGDQMTPLPSPDRQWVVLMLPEVPVEQGKTAQMYASLKPKHFTDGQTTRRLVEALITGLRFRPTMLVNTFDQIAFNPSSILSMYKERILALGAPHVHLCGSGPSLYALFDDKARADDLAVKCQNQGLKTYVVATV